MREQSQILPLHGPMDVDTYPKYVKSENGIVASRTNLRTSGSGGKKYVNRKLRGTLLVDTELPDGENTTIGWCRDEQSEAMVYFVYNSNDDHCVFRYYTKTKVLEKLWYAESTLGLEDTELRAKVVNGKVYWINGSQEPKGFNLEWAANYTNGNSGDAYSSDDAPFDENIFTLIRRPPQFAPSCQYDSDETYNFNNLRKKLFQFKYAFQYWDNQVSAWSSISKVPLPTQELNAIGEFVTDITKNNKIQIAINTGSHRVKKILIAARDTYPRNTGSFYQFETIEKFDEEGNQDILDNAIYLIDFYNNKRTTSIDTDVNNRYCDFVPLSGKDIEILDGKWLGIAYPETGYDKIDLDYTLKAVEQALDVEDDLSVYVMGTFYGNERLQGYFLRFEMCNFIYISSNPYYDSTYSISFTLSSPVGVRHIYVSTTTGSSISDYPRSVRDILLNQIRAEVSGLGIDNAYVQDANGSDRGIAMTFWNSDWDVNYPISDLQGSVTQAVRTYLPFTKSLKRGQYHPFALIYNDGNGRYNVVYGDEEMYSPLAESTDAIELGQSVLCKWEINHRPPIEAETFRWAYIRNKSYTYFQYFSYVESILGTGIGDNDIPSGKYFLKLNQSLERIRESMPNFIISDYVWQNGDRLRVVGADESYEILQEFTWTDIDSNEIVGYLIDAALCTHVDESGLDKCFIPLIEVYRPNPAPNDIVYLEVGEEFEILEPHTGNRRHAGPIANQNASLTTPAVGIMDFGDVYLRQRMATNSTGVPIVVIVEDEYFNDYYRSDAIDVGRAGAKIDSKKAFLNRVVRSENFIENTEYDLLNVWMPDSDYFHASNEYGEITGIEMVGDVLKIIQPHKETSIYIGRVEAKEGDDSTILVESDKVFGSPRRYVEFRGTSYRNSMLSNRRYLYYLDETTGEFVRSSANGQAPISAEYNMRTYFEGKCKQLREYSGYKDVIVSANNDFDEVYVTFIIGSTFETIVFSEEEGNKGWTFFCGLVDNTTGPERMGYYGDIMFSWVEGVLWVHDQTTEYNNFYGRQHFSSIEFYSNQYATMIKRFKNIRISTSDNIWEAEFTIPDDLTYGDQKTILKPSIMRIRDGQVVSDILRNIISKTGTETLSLLYKGQRMTGEFMKIKLFEEETEDVELRETEIKYLINT